MFWHPLILQLLIIGACVLVGVRYRLYLNYIKHERELEFAYKLDIDFEDLDKYPKAAIELLAERRKYDAYLATKEEKIT